MFTICNCEMACEYRRGNCLLNLAFQVPPSCATGENLGRANKKHEFITLSVPLNQSQRFYVSKAGPSASIASTLISITTCFRFQKLFHVFLMPYLNVANSFYLRITPLYDMSSSPRRTIPTCSSPAPFWDAYTIFCHWSDTVCDLKLWELFHSARNLSHTKVNRHRERHMKDDLAHALLRRRCHCHNPVQAQIAPFSSRPRSRWLSAT